MPLNGHRIVNSSPSNPMTPGDLNLFAAPEGTPPDPSTWFTFDESAGGVTITQWIHRNGVTYQFHQQEYPAE